MGISNNEANIEVTVPSDLYEKFKKYAENIGVTASSFINAKMQEFIKEEKVREKLKEKHKF